jgi:hypothetical protein
MMAGGVTPPQRKRQGASACGAAAEYANKGITFAFVLKSSQEIARAHVLSDTSAFTPMVVASCTLLIA